MHGILYAHSGHAMPSRTEREKIVLGRWTEQNLDEVLKTASTIKNTGERIDFLSRQFLGTPYQESTLSGAPHAPEIYTINLEAVDCFTLLDYVEAMRSSRSFSDFKKRLKRVRYYSGMVAYTQRKHFFTDWAEGNPSVTDVTEKIGRGKARIILKRLNRKADGKHFIQGIPVTERQVVCIPVGAVDGATMNSLRNGDYVGIYAEAEGLDVSHVGIIIKDRDAVRLRHASSAPAHRKVIDEEFRAYMSGKPGIIVLRPRA